MKVTITKMVNTVAIETTVEGEYEEVLKMLTRLSIVESEDPEYFIYKLKSVLQM